MKKINNKAFTLVELLVVITIIAILWVVAYTQFGWATDKAKSAAKMQNANSIAQALSMYKQEKGFYPWPATYNNKNIWWYDSTQNAKKTCEIGLTSDGDWKLTWSITTTKCWWKISDSAWTIIWAKWTFNYSWDIKKWLKKEAYDNEIWDLIYNNKKLIEEYWIGRFPYATYTKWMTNNKWTAYNIAYTTKKKDWTEITKILWDFNEASCAWCPNTLIWPWWSSLDVLKDWDTTNVPYKLNF